MEARRLAILYSHLCPFPSVSVPSLSSIVSPSACAPQSKETFPHDCVFCQIIRGDSPAFKLYEDDMCLCILDTRPLSPGHSLIIPKSHFPSLDTTPPSVVAAMCSKVPFISNAIIKVTGADSFNLLVNNGVAAGQVIFHCPFMGVNMTTSSFTEFASADPKGRPGNVGSCESSSRIAAKHF
ncbi:adenylylsulfatase HINT3 isoform X2 [Gossypium arboreum]|uniref:adenylylsulfatase HINT3 isoform X2 n=1 Tax=Gossypium arboreum TaxID=29729 RepID=UPI0022F15F02|nr:adenylylsulfatase HINT3 isoform X2 [Gossypium arboreum]